MCSVKCVYFKALFPHHCAVGTQSINQSINQIIIYNDILNPHKYLYYIALHINPMSTPYIFDEEGFKLIPLLVVKKPRATFALVKDNFSHEEFLVRVLGKVAYGRLHRLEVKLGNNKSCVTLTSSDDGNCIISTLLLLVVTSNTQICF